MSAILGAPWRLDEDGLVWDAAGCIVAHVYHAPSGPALAAVPELLAALEAAESVVRQGGRLNSYWLALARAALAKAKGETK